LVTVRVAAGRIAPTQMPGDTVGGVAGHAKSVRTASNRGQLKEPQNRWIRSQAVSRSDVAVA
jgi:hypothetical protein